MRSNNDRIEQRRELAHALAEVGWRDVLIIAREHAHQVTRPSRRDVIDALQAHDGAATIDELADQLERDENAVEDDVDYLFDLGITKRGERGISMKHEHVVIEPILDRGRGNCQG